MSRRWVPAVCALLALGAASACVLDAPVAPTASSTLSAELDASSSRGGNSATDTVQALKRSIPLTEDLRASATIGPEGGEIVLDDAGGKIVFPAGALRQATRITMIAKAGWNVAYEFCPHGITFDAPVVIVQELGKTVAASMKDVRTLQAGYYQQGLEAIFVDPGRSLARVTELRNVVLDQPLNPRAAKFYIYHFSGYILSSGFAPGSGGGDETPPVP